MDTIMAASTCKLFMGPITDETTHRYIDWLLGQQPVDVHDHRPMARRHPRRSSSSSTAPAHL